MRTETDSWREGTRLDHATVVILLATQACVGTVLGGLWLALMLGDAEVQNYGAVDYLAPVVVLGLGLALGACAVVVTRGGSSVLALVSVTQVLAMALGAYTLFRGAQVGIAPVMLGLLVLLKLYRRVSS